MRLSLPLLCALMSLAGPGLVHAQQAPEPPAIGAPSGFGPPLDAAQFEARTLGKTITYSQDGQPYGTEEYRPGHKVVWAFTESECREGDWFQQKDMICFDYHDAGDLQCWKFYDTPTGLLAQFQGDEMSQPLATLSENTAPLNCPGPDLGV